MICFGLLAPPFAIVGINTYLKNEFVYDTNYLFACVFIVDRSCKDNSAIDLLVKRFDRLVWIVGRAQLRIISSELSGHDVTIISEQVFDQSPGGDICVTN